MKTRLYPSALAGFLFGFDTVVISGAEQTIQGLWHLSAAVHGLAMGSALYGTVLGSLLGSWPTDRFGRRTLLYVGSVGYIVSLGLTAWAFFSGHYVIVPACIFAFIASHAIGQGAVIWVLISEIFPNRHRATGQALGSFTHWIFVALLTTFFPSMVSAFHPGYVFSLFAGMMVLQLIWVRLMVPETKGIALEDLEHQLTGCGVRPLH
jgi:MFS family permease